MANSDGWTGPDPLPFENVLHMLVEHARNAEAPMMLVGATARDVALGLAGIHDPRRATNDVDIVVAVGNQLAFETLVQGLKPSSPTSEHKFLLDGVEVDIVPFGGIETEDRTITWRDGNVMNTLGFAEAIQLATDVRLSSGDVIKVATVDSLCALKLFAWADRNSWTSRDTVDLRSLILAYSEGSFLDGIYADYRYPILEQHDFVPRLAGAHWLGHDIRSRLGIAVALRCLRILDDTRDRVASAMSRSVDENLSLLDAVSLGLGESEG